MIIRNWILICCLFSITFLSGQEISNSAAFFVYGKILEEETNQPLEYATIILKNTETKKITGGVTDQSGNFNIQTSKGIYDIR